MSTREVTAGLSADVLTAGPPPVPMLTPPWTVRSLTPGGDDPALVSRWMNEPHVALFWQQAWPPARWAEDLASQRAGDYSRPLLISLEGDPFAYVEVYRTPRDVIGPHYGAACFDLGIHLAIGNLASTGRGLGRQMVRAVALGLGAADARVRRILADPDERHLMARRMFLAAGFAFLGVHDLGHKNAALYAFPLPNPEGRS